MRLCFMRLTVELGRGSELERLPTLQKDCKGKSRGNDCPRETSEDHQFPRPLTAADILKHITRLHWDHTGQPEKEMLPALCRQGNQGSEKL